MSQAKEIYMNLCDLIDDDAVCDVQLYNHSETLLEKLEELKHQLADYIIKEEV